jgi:hypothetical protein
MNRTLAAGLLLSVLSTQAFAASTPLYAGLQLDNTSVSGLLGYKINKVYAVEAHLTRSDTHISQSGMTSDVNINAAGLAGIAMLPMKLDGGSSYFLFVKAGFERINKEESYNIPASVTLSLPYSGTATNIENRGIFGGGAQYDFYQGLSGRVGFDLVGDKRSVYLGAIFKF